MTALRLVVTLLISLFGGIGEMWGQESYEGTWYIAHNKNYYLVPAAGYYQGNDETPYITTYQTGKDKNSIWRIVKVEDGDDTYYRFIHNATGKYLTANDVVDNSNPARMRMHLEAFDIPTDATLFIIVKHTSTTNAKVAIRSKSYNDSASDCYWFDIANGNKQNYWNGNFDGSLGFWRSLSASNDAAFWTLETAASTCATPVIKYDGTAGTFSISYPISSDGATIHYTTDGSEPTADSQTYDGAIDQGIVTDKVRAIAMKTDYENSLVAEMDPPRAYLLKTNDAANVSYYMIPPLDETSTTDLYVTTSNVPNEKMVWQLKPASFDGVQSYHLYNPTTGKYAYCKSNMNGSNALVMKPLGEEGTEVVRYKFCLYLTGDYYNIVPKIFSYKLPTADNNSLYKNNGNNHTDYISLKKDNANGYPRWQFVTVPDDPKTLFDRSFATTEEGVVSYWKIQNVKDNTYYVTPPSTTNVFATASTNGSNVTWFFEEADIDDWNTYYYIRNAVTGGYLYYDADRDNNNKFLTSSTPMGEIYQFVVARTANTSATTSYNIIPRPLKDTPNQANIAMNRVSNTNLRIGNSRNNNNAHWILIADNSFKCEEPTFSYTSSGSNVILTITSPTPGASIYYTTDGSDPDLTNTESTHILYSGAVTIAATVSSVKMIAARSSDGSDQSEVVSFEKPTIITQASDITSATGIYILSEDFSFDRTSAIHFDGGFQGTIDGQMNTFTISCPMFDKVDGAVIKNVILENVSIDESGNVGAIANEATGATRIYNCGILGGSVKGTAYTGSLVGLLDGSSRVINCFSYANITGGSVRAGIVGYNNYASKYDNPKTMVMNCMFYGDIDVVDDLYPIYGGYEISNDYNSNDANRLNNYNYFLYEAPYSVGRHIAGAHYNCALAAEERFLVRFEFYRHLLNSTRELAAWYATGSTSDAHSTMAKWVLDKSIAPYPILKVQGKYPSVVNYDPDNTYDADKKEIVARSSISADTSNKGRYLSDLNVIISESNTTTGGQTKPSGALVTTTSLTLKRTDKDFDNYNFNYDKVQLPYYNDIGNGNYTGNRVVTGWKITGFLGGTQGERVAADFTTTTNYDAPYYNFADRDTYAKDLYSISGRVFAQGAYFNVPTGVTGITIEPYWAVCTYLSDAYYDSYGYVDGGNNDIFGTRYVNDRVYEINGSSQKVYTSAGNAVSNLKNVTSPTVYDYAIVLVGNYHACGTGEVSSGDTPFTIMSIDNNRDNEPDYSLIFKSAKNQQCSPIRYDFINVPAAAMAYKMASSTDLAIPGNCFPKGWYEVTTTGLIKFGQLEYSANVTTLSPLILMGGVVEQIVSTNNSNNSGNKRYLLFGDNVWFKLFNNGAHSDQSGGTPHRPISVTGGEYEHFYLTGHFLYDKGTRSVISDNAECYIDGGKFGEVAGTGQEKVDGNVSWFVSNADIESFFGGGINDKLPITGNISSQLKNSRINLFCGGPKFGNMSATKTVTTTATGCTFGTYFGAGYGGNAIYRHRVKNEYTILNYDWTNWVNGSYDNSSDGNYRGKYTAEQGIALGYEYEFFAGSSGNVARLYIQKVSFSLAQTNNVTSTLTDCKVLQNLYGGGSLGKVAGDATTMLIDCKVKGNVFGAGFSATMDDVEVLNTGGLNPTPNYNQTTGIYEQGEFPSKQIFKWKQVSSISGGAQCLEVDGDNRYIKTTQNLVQSNLGSVDGNVILTIKGNSVIGTEGDATGKKGNVFGGGESSYVTGADNTVTVNIQGKTQVLGNVFGGGDQGVVEGSTTVNIQE